MNVQVYKAFSFAFIFVSRYITAPPNIFSFSKDGTTIIKKYTYSQDDSLTIELLYIEGGTEKLYCLMLNLIKREEE